RAGLPPPNLDWPSDILECLCAAVAELGVETVAHILMYSGRHADATRCRDLLQASGDIDAITEDVIALGDDVAKVDTRTERDAAPSGTVGRRGAARRLHLDRTAHSIDHAGEFQEQAVAGGLDDAASMAGDHRVDHLVPKRFQRRQGAALVAPHQPRVARNVG